MTAIAPALFERLAEHLAELGAPAVALYRDSCFERRLATRLRLRGCSLTEYLAVLEREPEERDRLLSALVVGVTSFFRNPPAWRRLREILAARPPAEQPFRAWSAGCATGEEAYSVAMLLAALEADGSPGVRRWEVVGTDLDERSLAVARAGCYSLRAGAEIEAVLPIPAPSRRPDGVEVAPGLRERVRFEREDLIHSARTAAVDLVICRNVLIYFGEAGHARVIDALVRALRPGGLLMLGKAELAAHTIAALEPLDSRERIYRRAR